LHIKVNGAKARGVTMKISVYNIISKKGHIISLLVLLIFLALSSPAGKAQQYKIDWYTIDGGGGTSSGGPYVLTGTIGQPDADWCKGGNYELLGGFWPSGPICIVDFEHFARFAQQWLDVGSGLPGDLDGDNDVDFDDLTLFVDVWLCCCPIDWPLK
jgi:hypothetical protein